MNIATSATTDAHRVRHDCGGFDLGGEERFFDLAASPLEIALPSSSSGHEAVLI